MKYLIISLLFIVTNFATFAQKPLPASNIIKNACTNATQQHKKILLIFKASWCGWCKKLDAAMNDATTKKIFNKYFVVTHLTVQESYNKKYLENAGSDSILQKFKGTTAGLPFFVILNNTGLVLGDSFVNNSNMGCPSTDDEVKNFIELLQKNTELNNIEAAAIYKRFIKNQLPK